MKSIPTKESLSLSFTLVFSSSFIAGCGVTSSQDCTAFEKKSVALSMVAPHDENFMFLPSPESYEWANYVLDNGDGCASDSLMQQARDVLSLQ